MTKGRVMMTWQERLDIVLYCLANEQNYTMTASHFHISYQRVYIWVKKYEAGECYGTTEGAPKYQKSLRKQIVTGML
jgi:transposase